MTLLQLALSVALSLTFSACSEKKPAPSQPTRTPYTLSAPVEIIIDDWGAAHIYAQNKLDATFALCYQTAHDRLFQVDYTVRNVLGRLAEWFGSEKAEDDRLRKIIGFERISQATWQQMQILAPDVAERLWACSDGFNAYIKHAKNRENGARFPPEYAMIDPDYVPPTVDPTYIIAVGKAIAFELSFTGDVELLMYLFRTLFGRTLFYDIVYHQPIEATTIVDGVDTARWGINRSSKAQFAASRPTLGDNSKTTSHSNTLPPGASEQIKLLKKLKPFGGLRFAGPSGSNNWVVSGKHSQTGFALLANDPHLGFELPPKFYEVHLQYYEDGDLVDAQGITLAGAPIVLIGHNQFIAWGLTTTGSDVTDLYLENINSSGDTVLWDNGKKIKLINSPESICVRQPGGSVADCKKIPITVRVVPGHGPLLNDIAPVLTDLLGTVSVRWTGFEPTGELVGIDRLNKAKNITQAITALQHFQVGQQNFVMADVEGNIGYFAPAYIPIRQWDLREFPPFFPLPGNGKFEWAGFYDYSWVPQVINPSKGYIVSANNDPLGNTLDNLPTNDEFYAGHFFDLGTRAQRITTRIEQKLSAGQKLTIADMQSIQADVHSVLADHLLPHLLPLRPSNSSCAGANELELCAAFDALAAWNHSSDADATAPTLFHFWLAALIQEVFRDDIPLFDAAAGMLGGFESQVFARALIHWLNGNTPASGKNYFDKQNTPTIETQEQIMLLALRQALAHGRQLFLTTTSAPEPISQWTWGRFHQAEFAHLWLKDNPRFTPAPYPFHGGKNNVDASDYNMFDETGLAQQGIQGGGPMMRMVIEVNANNWRIENAIPGGASGDPDNPHYKDQLEELWLKNLTRTVPYTRAEVEAQAAQRKTLPSGFPN